MIIKKASVEDAEVILKLQKLAFASEAEVYQNYDIPPLTQTLSEIKEDFKKQLFLKAVVNEEIVGSVKAFEENGTCYVGRLIVHPLHQNQGIGTKLMKEIEARFSQCKRFELYAGGRSKKNIYLYRKLGYKIFKKERISEKVALIYMEKSN